MPIDFPTSPSVDDVYTFNGRSWKWNGEGWESVTAAYGPTGPSGSTGPSPISGVNEQTGTSYSLVLSDNHKMVKLTNSSAVTITVPNASSQSWETGSSVYLVQSGLGQVLIGADTGVTLRYTLLPKTRAQYSTLSLVYLGSDEWVITGDMAIS